MRDWGLGFRDGSLGVYRGLYCYIDMYHYLVEAFCLQELWEGLQRIKRLECNYRV